ncbi:hypothetical protein HRbin33_01871 [bacterium HR33]|nr:hypothetical protein HRbin33_01871 [bacterium HR33]
MFSELHLVALVCYGLTGALVAAPLWGLTRAGGSGFSFGLFAAAVAVHFLALLSYTVSFGELPFRALAAQLSSLGFFVGFLSLAIQWLTRERAIALISAPLVILLLAGALTLGFGAAPAARSEGGPWFVLHGGASLLGLALMAVAFAASALYLLQHRELKARRFGAIFQSLPPLEQLDRLNHLALLLGFPTLTLGIVLGAAYLGLRRAEGEGMLVGAGHLGWGLASWFMLGVLVLARAARRLGGRQAAVGSIVLFGVIGLGYFLLMLWDTLSG